MHPRVSLHQIAFASETTVQFLDFCGELGVHHGTLASPFLIHDLEKNTPLETLANHNVQISCINHPFAIYPNLEHDTGQAAAELLRTIAIAEQLATSAIYLLTGGRGTLLWEEAASRFTDLLTPCHKAAEQAGITLLIENASAFNADIHIAHSLPDVTLLAQKSGVGICIELHACWAEAGLNNNLSAALPRTGLIQVSDYVLGDRNSPCRAVPGDGTIPLEPLLRHVLETGYQGLFDIELIGPRIDAEGNRSACTRSVQYLSDLLYRLGA